MIQNFLYIDNEIKINDKISIHMPKVKEIVENENLYYNLVSIIVAMPIDMMVMLDDAGIDFTTINEYELFLLMFPQLKSQDTHLIFGDLDLSNFQLTINEQNEMPVLYDPENDILIDRGIYEQITFTLRKINHLKKDKRKPGNEAAKKYIIEKERKKLKRKKEQESTLEPLIVSMVNTEQYKYDFAGTKELTIYQFNESVKQVIKKVDYDNKMHGVYSGTVNIKDLSSNDLNWLTHK